MTKTEDTTVNLDIREDIKYDEEPGREVKEAGAMFANTIYGL